MTASRSIPMDKIWTLQMALNWTIDYLTSKKISEPRLSAELLLADVLNCKRIELYVQFERILTREERATFRTYVQRRINHEPVQYILGETEFMGLPFKVNPAVLIPRPETEILVDFVFQHIKQKESHPYHIIDVGTGSGCIAIAIARFFPKSQIWAIEKSAAALKIAKENALQNEVNIQFMEGDFYKEIPLLENKFDVLVSNPPYISGNEFSKLDPQVSQYEPKEALYGGNDGLSFYRKIASLAKVILTSGGIVFLETGYNQGQIVAKIFEEHNFKTDIHKDYNKIERVVIAYPK